MCIDIFSWKLPDINYDLRGEELEAALRGRTLPVQLRATLKSCPAKFPHSTHTHTFLLLVPVKRNVIHIGMKC